MTRAPILVAAAIASVLAAGSALAQQHWNRDGANRNGGAHRDGPHYGGNRGWSHGGRGYDYGRRYYGPQRWHGGYGVYDPYWFYGASAFRYAYPLYEPAPVIVQPPVYLPPVYEPRRIYEAPPPAYEPPYEERSYAQIAPPPPPPPATSAPATPSPRLERYTLSAKELFGFDEATIRHANGRLDEIAAVMRRNPQIDAVTITGYTDRIGTEAYNLKLSKRRAEAVKSYLVAKGVEARRLTAIGKGKANPVVQCNDKDRAALIQCLEPNRRVEVEQITIERRR